MIGALGGDQAIARQRRRGPHAHDLGAGRIADVARRVEQADRHVVLLHVPLEPLEASRAKLLVIDIGQGGHAQGLHMRAMRPMLFATNGHDWNSYE
jgi:hypothetical protein